MVIIPTYKVPKAQLSNLSATADQLGLKDLQAAVEKCFNKSHISQIVDFGESETQPKQQEHESTVALIDHASLDEDQNFEAVDEELVEAKFSFNLLQEDEEIAKSFEEEEDKLETKFSSNPLQGDEEGEEMKSFGDEEDKLETKFSPNPLKGEEGEDMKSFGDEDDKLETKTNTAIDFYKKGFAQSKLYRKLPKIDVIPANSEGRYPCNQCNQSCDRWTNLKHHILRQHEGYLYKCTKCEDEFDSIPKIEWHHVENHERGSSQCEHCRTTFRSSVKLKKHQSNNMLTCQECDFMACNKIVLTMHTKLHDPRFRNGFFHCNLCPFQAKKKFQADEHKKVVHDKVRKHCDQCDFTGRQMSDIIEHKRVQHEGLKYQCDLCDYTANRSHRVTRHKAIQHDGFRYQCNLCDYKGMTTARLQDHKLSKHDKKVFSCPICDLQVFYRSSLQRHIKQHAKAKMKNVKNLENQNNEGVSEQAPKKIKTPKIKGKKARRSQSSGKGFSQDDIETKERKSSKKVKTITSRTRCEASTNCCRIWSGTKDKAPLEDIGESE